MTNWKWILIRTSTYIQIGLHWIKCPGKQVPLVFYFNQKCYFRTLYRHIYTYLNDAPYEYLLEIKSLLIVLEIVVNLLPTSLFKFEANLKHVCTYYENTKLINKISSYIKKTILRNVKQTEYYSLRKKLFFKLMLERTIQKANIITGKELLQILLQIRTTWSNN